MDGRRRLPLLLTGPLAAKVDELPNLTVNRIPAAVPGRCEWNNDDDSLHVRGVGSSGETWEAVNRVAALPDLSVFASQAYLPILPDT